MKANQAFRNDEAVSPVIAVILMVAITVVLAATVYVWVSGFGSQPQQPAKSIALMANAPLKNTYINYTVSSATSGLKWADLRLTIDGVEQAQDPTAGCPDATTGETPKFVVCSDAATEEDTDTVNAGDLIKIRATSGQTLRFLDVSANAVVMTLHIG